MNPYDQRCGGPSTVLWQLWCREDLACRNVNFEWSLAVVGRTGERGPDFGGRGGEEEGPCCQCEGANPYHQRCGGPSTVYGMIEWYIRLGTLPFAVRTGKWERGVDLGTGWLLKGKTLFSRRRSESVSSEMWMLLYCPWYDRMVDSSWNLAVRCSHRKVGKRS